MIGKSSIPSMWYVIMLSVCIDQGDGRWKERDKENLQHDIMAYKKIAEKLEREIEAFYDEYPTEWLKGGNAEKIHSIYLSKILNRNTEIRKNIENTHKGKHVFPFVPVTHVTATTEPTTDTSMKLVQNHSNKHKVTDWPTFQDILLATGRKYDWKNDRWLKVKEKPKKIKTSVRVQVNSEMNISEKHKFSYRIVKLSKSKNRRNIVVAVSAVR